MHQSQHARYRAQQLRRRRICYTFIPAGFGMMLLLQWLAPDTGLLLAWPVLLIYIVGTVSWLSKLDHCPWCKQSFHTPTIPDGVQGLKAVLRQHCANCGMPGSAAAKPGERDPD
jgi:hypothetical protein